MTDSEYIDFMRQYALEHELCPKCGYDICQSTLMGFSFDRNNKEIYRDKNKCVCLACGHEHISHDRISREEFKNGE